MSPVGEAIRVWFTELARLYGAPDPVEVADAVQARHGDEAMTADSAAAVIAELQTAVDWARDR